METLIKMKFPKQIFCNLSQCFLNFFKIFLKFIIQFFHFYLKFAPNANHNYIFWELKYIAILLIAKFWLRLLNGKIL